MSESPQPLYARDTVPDFQVADHAANTNEGPAHSPVWWRFTLLGEVANFALLRRHLGRDRVQAAMDAIAMLLGELIPGSLVRQESANAFEVRFDGLRRADVDTALARIESAFLHPVGLVGEYLDIDFVMGAAAAFGPDCDDVQVIEEAERARDAARIGLGAVVRDLGDATPKIDTIAFARELDAAIAGDELFLHYQPKMHVRRQAIVSVEALIRWNHPERGLIAPGDFIPLAEEMDIMAGVTLWTIRRVIADQRVMASHGHDLRVFINVAGGLLADPRFVSEAGALVAASHVPFGFEITETSVIDDPETAIANLHSFAALGIVISIDDYGAGLSSLAYLKQLPARELKIDKLFVTQLTSSNRDPLIVRSTIDLAHALEMDVVAEGVETQSALALLSVMGCDMVQGYLISRPIGIGALIPFLSDRAHLAVTRDTHASFDRFRAVRKHG